MTFQDDDEDSDPWVDDPWADDEDPDDQEEEEDVISGREARLKEVQDLIDAPTEEEVEREGALIASKMRQAASVYEVSARKVDVSYLVDCRHFSQQEFE